MQMTTGVGLSDFACQKSSTLRSCLPYETLACVGGISGIGSFFSTFFSSFLASCAGRFIAARPRARIEQNKILIMTRSPWKLTSTAPVQLQLWRPRDYDMADRFCVMGPECAPRVH